MKYREGNVGDTVRIRCTIDGNIGRRGKITMASYPIYRVMLQNGEEKTFVSCDLEMIKSGPR